MTTKSRAISAGKAHAPKSVSLAALVGADRRVRDAYRESVNETLKEFEKYLQANPELAPETITNASSKRKPKQRRRRAR